MKTLLIVAGPTGSGKTDLAIKFAKRFNSEVINADSVQMYKTCDIGSAKPSLAERQGVRHHLFDICEPNEVNSAAFFLQEADKVIQRLILSNKVPIICGGTNLYLKALLYGLADLPQGNESVRAKLEKQTTSDLYQVLIKVDPKTSLHPNDRKRIIRALEVYELNGQAASLLQQQHAFANLCFSAVIFIPCYPRDVLYARINERTKKMLDAGLIDETEEIIKQYGASLPVLKTVGYFEVSEFLAGRLLRADLEEAISQATRRLAKRQLTFWRNEPIKRGWQVKEGSVDKCGVFQNTDIQSLLNEQNNPKAKRGIQKDILPNKMSFSELCSIFNSVAFNAVTNTVQVVFFSL